ncbi:MAG: DNA polymerase III subunit gamma/tau, partial [Pseudomonadales bacterium]|nr:DNA polymerase III subunit gamma/tau [Pseudomonadales bacterium]
MAYQVLARKYRPGDFKSMEGQGHVLQALINALDQDRLHHAYLFTGTRGVGKTTIARIFAKCLNCAQGVTSEPCGSCASCVEISEGRSVDLIEVDAASRTGVDDMRELLDNVQYLPTASRFKVYLIDEVHMLSKSSFNAMLKTLEEPPEHVKFLFATTDPKKLPVTVLSRCLQFNLKNMSPERVVNHLRGVLTAEGIDVEEAALWQLGRAADGSMRDALSLTDQAIAFGSGKLLEREVATMLGTVDRQEVFHLIEALAAGNGVEIYRLIEQIADFAPDYEALLDELLMVLHKIAVFQVVPEGVDNSLGDREKIQGLADLLTPDSVQLFYQIGLVGKRDLNLAPDVRLGFEMTLIRMLAFETDGAPPGVRKAATAPAPESPTPIPASVSPLQDLKASLSNAEPRAVEAVDAPAKTTISPAQRLASPTSPERVLEPKSAAQVRDQTTAITDLDSGSREKADAHSAGAEVRSLKPIKDPQSVLKGAAAAEVQAPEGAGEMAAKDRAKTAEPVQVVASSGLPASEDNPVLPAVADSQDLLWCELLIQTGIGGVAYAMASNCVLA